MSEDIGALSEGARLLYIALWCHADREGRMKYAPVALAAQTMPFEMDKFGSFLNELIKKNHIRPYEVENRKYLFIPTFLEHQRPHNTEKVSICPAFNGELTVRLALGNGEPPTGKGKGKGKGRGKDIGQNEFDRFWDVYPKKVKKKPAIKKWESLNASPELIEIIIKAVEDQNKTTWAGKEKQHIPAPDVWLNQERWNDESIKTGDTNGNSKQPETDPEWLK